MENTELVEKKNGAHWETKVISITSEKFPEGMPLSSLAQLPHTMISQYYHPLCHRVQSHNWQSIQSSIFLFFYPFLSEAYLSLSLSLPIHFMQTRALLLLLTLEAPLPWHCLALKNICLNGILILYNFLFWVMLYTF